MAMHVVLGGTPTMQRVGRAARIELSMMVKDAIDAFRALPHASAGIRSNMAGAGGSRSSHIPASGIKYGARFFGMDWAGQRDDTMHVWE
jgi:hypothetical protein